MSWIEVHDTLPDHPKTIASAAALRIDKDALAGKLLRLWTWALDNRTAGFIPRIDRGTVAERMRWTKKPEALFEGLCAVPEGYAHGFLREEGDGYVIHDWAVYTHRYHALDQARKRDRERKQKQKEWEDAGGHSGGIPAETGRISSGIPSEAARNSVSYPDPTGPNPTVPDPSGETDLFDRWWAGYPRKTGKKAAREVFARLRPDPGLVARMMDAVEAQKGSRQWRADGGRYIPHPRTWLQQGRWEDEVEGAEDVGEETGEAFRWVPPEGFEG